MNPVFGILVALAAVALWAMLNIFFPFIGSVILDIYNDIKQSLNKKEEN